MKEFFQRKGETVVVDGAMAITILEIRNGEVVIELDGPGRVELPEGESPQEAGTFASILPR